MRRIVITLLVLVLLPMGCVGPNIPDSVIESDLNRLDRAIAGAEIEEQRYLEVMESKQREYSLGLSVAMPRLPASRGWYIYYRDNSRYKGPQDILREIRAEPKPGWLSGSSIFGARLPLKEEDFTPEAIKQGTEALITNYGGTDQQIRTALLYADKYPNWLPHHTSMVVMSALDYGMNMEQVTVSWGEPHYKKVLPNYEAWWYDSGNRERGFLAFNKNGVLFYMVTNW